MSPGGYLALAAILTFAAVVCLRTNRNLFALMLAIGTWTIVPLIIFSDRLSFDGVMLRRTGLYAFATKFLGRSHNLLLTDIERVEVTSLRTLRRGGNVRYRYRVDVMGNDQAFAFASGGKQFRRMIHALLPNIPDHKLDARACELRDHLAETKVVRAEAERLGVAPAVVLENAKAAAAEKRIEKHRREPTSLNAEAEAERAVLLRRVANDLRISGRLQQSAEAFRRALLITPQHGWLIYEYARLLKSQASAFADARLLSRACAALTLAARRAPADARLLERIGESFLEYCDPARASKAFRRALDVDEDAHRAQLGLAEVALAQGKLAHVIHHYNEATRSSPDKPAARLARREADYYSRLNADEDYLAAEVRRMNWLEAAGRVQRLTARVSFGAVLIALGGSSVNPLVGQFGWAVASSSIIAWSGSLVVRRFLSSRRRLAADA